MGVMHDIHTFFALELALSKKFCARKDRSFYWTPAGYKLKNKARNALHFFRFLNLQFTIEQKSLIFNFKHCHSFKIFEEFGACDIRHVLKL